MKFCIVEFGEFEIYDLCLLPKAQIVKKLLERLKHDKEAWRSYETDDESAPDEPAAEPQSDSSEKQKADAVVCSVMRRSD